MNNKHTTTLIRALILGLSFAPTLAQAHPGHGATSIASGFAHPMFGLDHLLAMFATGLWASQLGGKAKFIVPASFVALMAAGGALAMNGLVIPGVEQGIIASVLVLGVLIAASVRLPVMLSAAIVGVFALFHGSAHGMELPANASALSFSFGFALSTAVLHGVGIAFGSMVKDAQAVRVSGAAIAGLSILLALGWL